MSHSRQPELLKVCHISVPGNICMFSNLHFISVKTAVVCFNLDSVAGDIEITCLNEAEPNRIIHAGNDDWSTFVHTKIQTDTMLKKGCWPLSYGTRTCHAETPLPPHPLSIHYLNKRIYEMTRKLKERSGTLLLSKVFQTVYKKKKWEWVI